MMPGRASQQIFRASLALLFAASSAVTVIWCSAMPPICGMAEPGDWTTSMAWMRMPGQSWLNASASFVAIWSVMMVAMMLPSTAPALSRYHQAAGATGQAQPALLAALAGAGYFCVWSLLGAAIFPAGAAMMAMETRLPSLVRTVPVVAAGVMLAAGALQFSVWKQRHLNRCRMAGACEPGTTPASAWLHGLRLGQHCCLSCAGPTAILLAAGGMDLRAMAAVTVAITAERIAPAGVRIARWSRAVALMAGVLLILHAAGSG